MALSCSAPYRSAIPCVTNCSFACRPLSSSRYAARPTYRALSSMPAALTAFRSSRSNVFKIYLHPRNGPDVQRRRQGKHQAGEQQDESRPFDLAVLAVLIVRCSRFYEKRDHEDKVQCGEHYCIYNRFDLLCRALPCTLDHARHVSRLSKRRRRKKAHGCHQHTYCRQFLFHRHLLLFRALWVQPLCRKALSGTSSIRFRACPYAEKRTHPGSCPANAAAAAFSACFSA